LDFVEKRKLRSTLLPKTANGEATFDFVERIVRTGIRVVNYLFMAALMTGNVTFTNLFCFGVYPSEFVSVAKTKYYVHSDTDDINVCNELNSLATTVHFCRFCSYYTIFVRTHCTRGLWNCLAVCFDCLNSCCGVCGILPIIFVYFLALFAGNVETDYFIKLEDSGGLLFLYAW